MRTHGDFIVLPHWRHQATSTMTWFIIVGFEATGFEPWSSETNYSKTSLSDTYRPLPSSPSPLPPFTAPPFQQPPLSPDARISPCLLLEITCYSPKWRWQAAATRRRPSFIYSGRHCADDTMTVRLFWRERERTVGDGPF